jgi:hypothetical protein
MTSSDVRYCKEKLPTHKISADVILSVLQLFTNVIFCVNKADLIARAEL